MFYVLSAIVDRKFKVGLSSLSKKEGTWTQSPTLFANGSSWGRATQLFQWSEIGCVSHTLRQAWSTGVDGQQFGLYLSFEGVFL